MIGYLDTVALVPLVISEPSSAACREFWDAADDVVTVRVAYVEAAAALAQAERLGRLRPRELTAALRLLDQIWDEVAVVEVDDGLVRRAAWLARELGLRGYDAIHCAAAEEVADPDLVAASGDQRLLAAWATCGLTTYDANG